MNNLMRRLLSVSALTVLLAGSAMAESVPNSKAGKGAPPEGVYNCEKISGSMLIGLGKLEIRGKNYRGMDEPGKGTFAPFTVDGSNNIVWSKGLTGMPDGWTVVQSRWIGNNEVGHPLIQIYYRSERGTMDMIDAVRD